MGGRLALARGLVLLYLVAVVVESAVHQKRDIHHRIIIKEKRPRRVARPAKEHHHHQRPAAHKKRQRYKDASEEASYEDDSEERYDRSRSRENSFEDVHRKKKNSSKRHKHRSHSHKDTDSYRDDSRDSRYHGFREDSKYRNEWRPLSSEQVMDNIFRENRHYPKHKKSKKDKKHHGKHPTKDPMHNTGFFPYDIDMTTIYPSYNPYQFDSTIYPPLNAFHMYNQKVFQAHQPPLIGTIEQFTKPDYAELEEKAKNLVSPVNNPAFVHLNTPKPYEVHETLASDVVETKIKPIEATELPPVKKKEEIQSVSKKEPPKIDNKIPTRGRIRIRIKPKAV